MGLPSTPVTHVSILNEHEYHVLDSALAYLDSNYPAEGTHIREHFSYLETLGDISVRYPSADPVNLHQINDLIETISVIATSTNLLYIPIKILMARNVLIAKFHAFSLLFLLVHDSGEVKGPVRGVLVSIICTLMAEDVYLSCIIDPTYPQNIKVHLAKDLFVLWEQGHDPHAVQHFPALEALWIARDETPPVFGTMDGSSEMFRVSLGMESDWQDFLRTEINNEEIQWSLEEFLFGLSYEEITKIRGILVQSGVYAIDSSEIQSYLGNRNTYIILKNADPRSLYDFYVTRRDNGRFREKNGLPGPKKTIEELYFKYRLTEYAQKIG
ncbi:hypothetical protein PilKf_02316 [Pillotina sp. SPG140]|jgi:hypothetical protein